MKKDLHSQPVKHLLVDLDGTLLGNNSIPLSLQFVSLALKRLKELVGWRQAAKILYAIQEEFKQPHRILTNDLRVIELVSKSVNLTQEEARKFIRETLATIFPSLERHFYPMPGAKEFLDWAKERYPLILATNPVWPREIVEMRVRWAGIDPSIFCAITDVTRMHACKPTHEYYEEILAQQKLNPDDCLLIGDNMKMDLPASRVGIRVFIVGDHKRLAPLQYPNAQAPAWKGTYSQLRKWLEAQVDLESSAAR